MHNILPRVLRRLSRGNPPSAKVHLVEQAFEMAGLDIEGVDREGLDRPSTEDDWVSKLVQVDEQDTEQQLSYAELNQKRKRLTFESFQSETFLERITIMEDLVEPGVEAMYRLFKRTGTIADLCSLPDCPTVEKERLRKEWLGTNSPRHPWSIHHCNSTHSCLALSHSERSPENTHGKWKASAVNTTALVFS